MKSRDFVYWLQGYFEISGHETLNSDQVRAIRNHLNLVFKHEIDPAMGDQKMQDALNELHSAAKPDVLYRC